MSDSPDQPGRPQQVRMGAWMVIAAAAIHVIGSFDDMSGLRSLETRQRVDDALKSMAGSGLGVTRDQMLAYMHIGVLVSAAAATAAIVMGVQAMRRDRTAPWVLIGLSLLVVGGSIMFDPLMGMFIAAGTTLLWSGPARDWFAGRPVRLSRIEVAMQAAAEERKNQQLANSQHPEQPRPEPEQPPVPATPPPPQPYPAATPPPPQPYPATPPPPPPVYGYGAVPVGGSPRLMPAGAPTEVRVAVIITIVLSALTALGSAVTMAAMVFLPTDDVRRAINEALAQDPRLSSGLPAGVTMSDLIAMIGVVLGLFLIWAAIATVLAILTWRGHNWARVLLVISAVMAGLFSLLALPITLVHVLGAATVVVLLLVSRSNRWFRESASRREARPGGVGPGPSPYGQPPVPPPYGQVPPPGQQPPAAPPRDDPRRDEDGNPPLW